MEADWADRILKPIGRVPLGCLLGRLDFQADWAGCLSWVSESPEPIGQLLELSGILVPADWPIALYGRLEPIEILGRLADWGQPIGAD